jgi:hypothetical protein
MGEHPESHFELIPNHSSSPSSELWLKEASGKRSDNIFLDGLRTQGEWTEIG